MDRGRIKLNFHVLVKRVKFYRHSHEFIMVSSHVAYARQFQTRDTLIKA